MYRAKDDMYVCFCIWLFGTSAWKLYIIVLEQILGLQYCKSLLQCYQVSNMKKNIICVCVCVYLELRDMCLKSDCTREFEDNIINLKF